MPPHSVKLPIHLDCCESCPVLSHDNLLGVGGYELDPTTNTRHGQINIFCTKQQALKASSSTPGVFDVKWLPLETGLHKASLGLAAADGSIRVFGVTQVTHRYHEGDIMLMKSYCYLKPMPLKMGCVLSARCEFGGSCGRLHLRWCCP